MPSVFSEESRLQAAVRILRHFGRILDLPISVRLWDGTKIPLGASASQDQYVSISAPAVLGSLLRRRSLDVLFRHYVSGDIDLHGMDLLACFDVIRRKKLGKVKLGDLRRGFPWMAMLPLVLGREQPHELQHRFRGNESQSLRSRRDNKSLIQFHYDVSNEFYALFLDAEMIYSCAYFVDWDNSLDQAQRDKLDLICRKLEMRAGDRFLDVGCGWGGLIVHAAEQYGAIASGCTLSARQFGYVNDLIAARRLVGRVTAMNADYRAVAGRFDKIASVGMYEHVGRHRLHTYFETLSRLLRPDGLLLNHGIARPETVTDDASTVFLRRHVFPGGELPYLGDVIRAAERAGFEVLDLENLRPHYALTCARWVTRLQARRDACLAIVDAATYRTWLLYLAAAAVSFERGDTELYQLLLAHRRPGAGRQLTRTV